MKYVEIFHIAGVALLGVSSFLLMMLAFFRRNHESVYNNLNKSEKRIAFLSLFFLVLGFGFSAIYVVLR